MADEEIPNIRRITKRTTDELKQNRLSGDASLSKAFSALGQALSDFKTEVPEKEKDKFATGLTELFGDLSTKLGAQSKLDEIIVVGSVVVVYRPKLLNMNDDQKKKIRNAITAILTANPNADLVAIQDSIGITDVRIQRPPVPPPPDPGKYSDW